MTGSVPGTQWSSSATSTLALTSFTLKPLARLARWQGLIVGLSGNDSCSNGHAAHSEALRSETVCLR